MASISRLTTALFSGAQETTLALANVSFDFSIIKMDPPPEYQALGQHLSRKRKLDAEDGKAHITARQLGALFADDLPRIPNLKEAYGRRASDIVRCPKLQPLGTELTGPLADYVGADGTSIWAAATSGRGAIEAHLLACLLARIWSPPEAITIWSQLVAARQAILRQRLEQEQFHINLLTSSKIDIPREKLAEWDASARSWCQVADLAKEAQQKQLQLIIDNLDFRVPGKPTFYDSIMDVWTKSLIMMENLASGVAQTDPSGEALMALNAWHLYPDMYVVADGAPQSDIRQNDYLVPRGGLLTVGLHEGSISGPPGITWSMPLAHLRYYGNPLLCQRTLHSSSSRVSFRQLLQIAMGSLASEWHLKGSKAINLAECIVALRNECTKSYDMPTNWLHLFAEESQDYLSLPESARKATDYYINLGRRRPHWVANKGKHPLPCFGLSDPAFYLPQMNTEEQVRALRKISATMMTQDDMESAIIRTVRQDLQTTEYASVAPQYLRHSTKAFHRRWILLRDFFEGHEKMPYDYHISTHVLGTDASANVVYEDKLFGNRSSNTTDSSIRRSIEIIVGAGELCGFLYNSSVDDADSPAPIFRWESPKSPLPPLALDDLHPFARQSINERDEAKMLKGWRLGQLAHVFDNQNYVCMFGDPATSAVFIPMSNNYQDQLPVKYDLSFPTEKVVEQLQVGCFDSKWLHTYLRNLRTCNDKRYNDYFNSLEALAGAAEIYEVMPNAELEIKSWKGLHSFFWSRALCSNQFKMKREIAIACVSSFETGHLDLEPDKLRSVFAISSGNSIYAIEGIFQDPCHHYPLHRLRHVIGNVGKPGLGFLTSSQHLDSPELDPEDLKFVNTNVFDGKYENKFTATSLHLWLTGYERPLDTQISGARDKEFFFLEAVISACEGGKKVADIDLLKVIQDIQLPVYPDNVILRHPELHFLPSKCTHDDEQRLDSSIFGELISLDNWFEVLDLPPNSAIIRAKGNWLARLALAAFCVQKQLHLMVFSDHVCWACAKDTLASDLHDLEDQFLFLC